MNKLYKPPIIFFFAIMIITGCSQKEEEQPFYSERKPSRDLSYSFNSDSTNNIKVDLFSKLTVSNVSFYKEANGWYRFNGTIKNNHNKKIMGYFKVVLYDKNGGVVDSVIISVPGSSGLAAGESNVFSKSITQREFASYKFMDETLIEN